MIGKPTQIPIQSRTAGSGEMSPTTKPTMMAPYHQARPRRRSANLMARAMLAGTGRVAKAGWVRAARFVRVLTKKDAATATAVPAR